MKKELINIKGTKNGIIFIVAPELDFDAAAKLLQKKITQANGFFKNAKFNIKADHFTSQDIDQLYKICEPYGLVINLEAQLPNMDNLKTQQEIAATFIEEKPRLDDTLLIMRNLRSGQTIQYQGDIVVVGDVNPGAEIISEGNIIVMGKLRGVAHAGSSGKEDAYILAYRLQPTQLRICNHVSRAPENEHPIDYPEIAQYSPNGIYIEKYNRNFKG